MVLDKRVALMEQDEEMVGAIFFQQSPNSAAAASAMQQRPDDDEDDEDAEAVVERQRQSLSEARARRESHAEQRKQGIMDTPVPIDNVIKHMKRNTQQALLTSDFALYVPFLILFCLFSQRNVVEEHYANRIVKDLVMGNPIPNEVDKYYLDMQNAGDWGLWMSHVGIPNIWGPGGCGGDRYDKPNTFPYLQTKNNHVLGALRIRTQRVSNNSCARNAALYRTDSSLSAELLQKLDATACYGTWRGDDYADRMSRFHIPNPVDYPHLYFMIDTSALSYSIDWPTQWDGPWANMSTRAGLDAHFAKPDIVEFLFYNDGTRVKQIQAPAPTMLTDGTRRWNYTFAFENFQFDEYTVTSSPTSVTNLRIPTAWMMYVNGEPAPVDVLPELAPDGVTNFTNNKRLLPVRSIPGGRSAVMSLTVVVTHIAVDVVEDTAAKPFLYTFKKCQLSGFAGTIVGDFDSYNCGGYWIDIPFNTSCRIATDVAKLIQSVNAPFFDNYATRLLSAEFFFFNTYLDSFTSAKLYVEEAAGGVWRVKHQIRVFDLYTNEAPVVEVLLAVLVCYFFFAFVRDWYNYYKGRPPGSLDTRGKIIGFMLQFWNLLELVNLICLLIVYVTWIIWIAKSKQMDFLMPYEKADYPDQLDWMLNIEIFNRYTNAVNMIAVFMKFLKFVRLNSRLNVLSETISLKAADLLACLIVFFFIVFAYALTGMSLYGPAMFDYRNLGFAYESNLRVLLGDFDYWALKQENLILTAAFFWSYLVIALFLLLNFLIAILSEGFAQVHGDQYVPPLDEQLARYWVALKRILEPKRVWTGIKMKVKRGVRSRYRLLVDATEKLEQNRKALLESMDDPNDKAKIFLSELPAYIEEEYELLGEKYMEDLWSDIVEEYSHDEDYAKQRTTSAQSKLVEDSVREDADATFFEIDSTWHKLLVLQDSFDSILNGLSR
eukprot:TRINITY_DN7969_c0_g1_i1.p1 TRINITY_DN7969_c0_g1~~TRINITY_DN7969_c0_g1_i1.p1  ORF type:complete len:940 (+),score=295.37 TRINITY_DN7969_c0_g1_i1:109-2928(+)